MSLAGGEKMLLDFQSVIVVLWNFHHKYAQYKDIDTTNN